MDLVGYQRVSEGGFTPPSGSKLTLHVVTMSVMIVLCCDVGDRCN